MKTKEAIAQAIQSRQAIAKLLLDPDHDDAHEFQLAIQHSVHLIYHIKHELGALKWSNRLKHLQSNEPLITALDKADFLCLQECTNPADIQALLPQKQAFIHRINNTTSDHCVLLYDPTQFKIVDEPLLCALDNGKKPCILARFEHIRSGRPLIVGSVHHPGGAENQIDELMTWINTLKRTPDEAIEFYVPGDYNHTQVFFNQHPSSQYQMLYPTLSTMAGGDYGNTNQSIDALLTNAPAHQINLDRMHALPLTKPADMPLKVQFKDEHRYRAYASPSFDLGVQQEVPCEETKTAAESLGQNNATYAPRILF